MDEHWQVHALCAQTDPEQFFPTGTRGRLYDLHVAAAKAVCAGCPVRAECLELGRYHGYGIFGGLTAAERRPDAPPSRVPTGTVFGAGPAGGASRREVAAAGRIAARSGRPVADVAREFGVTDRSVYRWRATG